MLGQWNWVWPISPLWHEVFGKRFNLLWYNFLLLGKRFNLLWYNFLLLGKFSFAQIAKDWTNHPAIWLRRPLTFPLIQHLTSLILQSLFILAENSDWFRTVDLWYWMQLLCHVLLYPSQTPSYSFSHTHTQLPTFSLSHTLKRTHTYYISNSESIFLVTPETKPRGTARKAGIRFKSKLKFAAKANISI